MISLPNRRTLLALLALVLLTLTVVSCKNFFVDPKLTSLVITAAQPSVAVGVTDQLQAVGTYDDSSTKDLSSSVTWTPSPTGVVTITNSGLATGGAIGGTAMINAKTGTLTSNTLTVVVGTLTSVTLTASSNSVLPGGAVTFTATGNYSPGGATNNITSNVTWLSSNTQVISSVSAGSATVLSTAPQNATTTITATDPTTKVNGTTVITVQ